MDSGLFPGKTPGTVLVPQGIFVRSLAYIVDLFIVSVPIVAVVVARLPASTTPPTFSETFARADALRWWTLGAVLLYFFLMEGAFGRSLGKMLFRLRVIGAADGGTCGWSRSFVRNLIRPIDMMILTPLPAMISIAVTSGSQRLGDLGGHTQVVREVPQELAALLSQPMAARAAAARAASVAAAGAPAGSTAGAIPVGTAPQPPRQLMSCPYCHEPVARTAVVCDACRHYINQVSTAGEYDEMAPRPLLWSKDRQVRFDALWRLAFEDDVDSLTALQDAIPSWRAGDRRDAIFAFSQVADRRPLPFLRWMTDDPDPIIAVLAREAVASVEALVPALADEAAGQSGTPPSDAP